MRDAARAAAAAAALTATLAGCGGPESPADDALTADEIERLATAPERVERIDRSVLLEALPAARLAARPCRLTQGGVVLLAAGPDSAAVRIEDRLLVVPSAGPVGPTGAYFEGGGVSISIGRTGQASADGARALVQVANRVTGAMREFDATWSCPPGT